MRSLMDIGQAAAACGISRDKLRVMCGLGPYQRRPRRRGEASGPPVRWVDQVAHFDVAELLAWSASDEGRRISARAARVGVRRASWRHA